MVSGLTVLRKKERMVLLQIADKLQENIDELTELEVQNNGKTRREARSDAEEAAIHFVIMQVCLLCLMAKRMKPLGICRH